jgi:uncharacterized RDD family membrane protein YckC
VPVVTVARFVAEVVEAATTRKQLRELALNVQDDPRVAAGTGAVEYAGFGRRLLAVLIDVMLILCITTPVVGAIYGWDYLLDESRSLVPRPAEFLIAYVMPALATLVLWKTRQSTPGKMLLSMKIVDAQTGGAMSTRQMVIRYFAYLVSAIFLLGYFWVAFDPRRQGWHDKLAGTLVVVTRQ